MVNDSHQGIAVPMGAAFGTAVPMGSTVVDIRNVKQPFDAPAHMRKIRTRQGMMDYLDVKWRVAWIRHDHATAQIVTEQVEGSEQHARFKCTITLPNGAVSTGHGSETQQDFPDFYEKAETKAIGRACAVLGYGTDSATDLDDGEPLDGRGAAKDERASRRATPEEKEQIDQQHKRNLPQGAPAPPPAAVDGPSNVHQHAQLRTLAESGFDVAGRIAELGVGMIEDLTIGQAKELIIEGRTATRPRQQ